MKDNDPWKRSSKWWPTSALVYCPEIIFRPWYREGETGRVQRSFSLEEMNWQSGEAKEAGVHSEVCDRGEGCTEWEQWRSADEGSLTTLPSFHLSTNHHMNARNLPEARVKAEGNNIRALLRTRNNSCFQQPYRKPHISQGTGQKEYSEKFYLGNEEKITLNAILVLPKKLKNKTEKDQTIK